MWFCLEVVPISEVLARARALIVKHGWLQCDYGDTESGFCALGAFLWVQQHYGVDVIPAVVAFSAFAENNIPAWNDQPGRTLADVLTAFDNAIAAEQQRETEIAAANAVGTASRNQITFTLPPSVAVHVQEEDACCT